MKDEKDGKSEQEEVVCMGVSSRGRVRKRRVIPNNTEDQGIPAKVAKVTPKTEKVSTRTEKSLPNILSNSKSKGNVASASSNVLSQLQFMPADGKFPTTIPANQAILVNQPGGGQAILLTAQALQNNSLLKQLTRGQPLAIPLASNQAQPVIKALLASPNKDTSDPQKIQPFQLSLRSPVPQQSATVTTSNPTVNTAQPKVTAPVIVKQLLSTFTKSIAMPSKVVTTSAPTQYLSVDMLKGLPDSVVQTILRHQLQQGKLGPAQIQALAKQGIVYNPLFTGLITEASSTTTISTAAACISSKDAATAVIPKVTTLAGTVSTQVASAQVVSNGKATSCSPTALTTPFQVPTQYLSVEMLKGMPSELVQTILHHQFEQGKLGQAQKQALAKHGITYIPTTAETIVKPTSITAASAIPCAQGASSTEPIVIIPETQKSPAAKPTSTVNNVYLAVAQTVPAENIGTGTTKTVPIVSPVRPSISKQLLSIAETTSTPVSSTKTTQPITVTTSISPTSVEEPVIICGQQLSQPIFKILSKQAKRLNTSVQALMVKYPCMLTMPQQKPKYASNVTVRSLLEQKVREEQKKKKEESNDSNIPAVVESMEVVGKSEPQVYTALSTAGSMVTSTTVQGLPDTVSQLIKPLSTTASPILGTLSVDTSLSGTSSTPTTPIKTSVSPRVQITMGRFGDRNLRAQVAAKLAEVAKSPVIEEAVKTVITTVPTTLPTMQMKVTSSFVLPTRQPRRPVTITTAAMKKPIPVTLPIQTQSLLPKSTSVPSNTSGPVNTVTPSKKDTNTNTRPVNVAEVAKPKVNILPKNMQLKTQYMMMPQGQVVQGVILPQGFMVPQQLNPVNNLKVATPQMSTSVQAPNTTQVQSVVKELDFNNVTPTAVSLISGSKMTPTVLAPAIAPAAPVISVACTITSSTFSGQTAKIKDGTPQIQQARFMLNNGQLVMAPLGGVLTQPVKMPTGQALQGVVMQGQNVIVRPGGQQILTSQAPVSQQQVAYLQGPLVAVTKTVTQPTKSLSLPPSTSQVPKIHRVTAGNGNGSKQGSIAQILAAHQSLQQVASQTKAVTMTYNVPIAAQPVTNKVQQGIVPPQNVVNKGQQSLITGGTMLNQSQGLDQLLKIEKPAIANLALVSQAPQLSTSKSLTQQVQIGTASRGAQQEYIKLPMGALSGGQFAFVPRSGVSIAGGQNLTVASIASMAQSGQIALMQTPTGAVPMQIMSQQAVGLPVAQKEIATQQGVSAVQQVAPALKASTTVHHASVSTTSLLAPMPKMNATQPSVQVQKSATPNIIPKIVLPHKELVQSAQPVNTSSTGETLPQVKKEQVTKSSTVTPPTSQTEEPVTSGRQSPAPALAIGQIRHVKNVKISPTMGVAGQPRLVLYNINGQLVTGEGTPVKLDGGVLKPDPNGKVDPALLQAANVLPLPASLPENQTLAGQPIVEPVKGDVVATSNTQAVKTAKVNVPGSIPDTSLTEPAFASSAPLTSTAGHPVALVPNISVLQNHFPKENPSLNLQKAVSPVRSGPEPFTEDSPQSSKEQTAAKALAMLSSLQ